MKALTDTDRIWFGEHEGKMIKDVPASYLLWWYDENIDDGCQGARRESLLDYISDHLEQLEDEREEE
jgi:uncharacterized protein (DUF3820 family)